MQQNTSPPASGVTVHLGTPSGMTFFVVGGVSIILGGLVAAVTGPLGWSHGSWAAAYLVLVTGIAQVVLGVCQDRFTRGEVTSRTWVAELIALNIGSVLVIAGAVMATPWVVDIGGALILLALILMLIAVQGAELAAAVVVYRLVIVALVISIPIGLVLAYADAGGV